MSGPNYGMPQELAAPCCYSDGKPAHHAPAGTHPIWNISSDDGSKFDLWLCKFCAGVYGKPVPAPPAPSLLQRLFKKLSPGATK